MEKLRQRGKSDLLEGTQQVTDKTQMKTQELPGSQAHALCAQPGPVASHKN